MRQTPAPPELLGALDRLFTRFEQGAAAYVLRAEPYATPEDEALIDGIRAAADEDRVLAFRVARLVDEFDAVPEAGAFPYWYRDLNYLSAPYLGAFVLQAIEEDVALLDHILAAWPEVAPTLEVVRADRRARHERLAALVAEAIAREDATHQRERGVLVEAREARVQKAKEERERARKAAAAATKSKAAAPTPAAATPSADELPDPNEPGIDRKEKARRQILRMRAKKEGG